MVPTRSRRFRRGWELDEGGEGPSLSLAFLVCADPGLLESSSPALPLACGPVAGAARRADRLPPAPGGASASLPFCMERRRPSPDSCLPTAMAACSLACRSRCVLAIMALKLREATEPRLSVAARAAAAWSREARAWRRPAGSSPRSGSTVRTTTSRPERTKIMRSARSPCLQASALPLRCVSLRQLAMARMSCGLTSWFLRASSMRGNCLRNFTRCSMKSRWC
mmetsp:Transcript_75681/g.182952  ORF Transcript_75681/g.182952 Transcript_75681/m.182952 type:complete len:224 (-) Transcript_75681:551-1222(-)